jgi:hypothetical protein
MTLFDLVAAAMGRPREDKFKKYAHWGDPPKILRDAEKFVLDAPFPHQRIVEVVQAVFGGSSGNDL